MPLLAVAAVSVAVAGAPAGATLCRSLDMAPEVLLDATEPATMLALSRDETTVLAGAAPWIRITVATSAVARITAFFNVCTPIQRLHCPPI
ncbi:MAG: hypothetical protein QOH69_1947 [Actinomycetota bacterium]|nr:hypothetical protein [Actinomycetota bacterium]